MALNPEQLFPWQADNLGDFEGGGKFYYPSYVNASVNSQVYKLGQSVHIDLSELVHTVHYSEATALYKKVLKFPNGVELGVRFWCINFSQPSSTIWEGWIVTGQWVFKYNNQITWVRAAAAGMNDNDIKSDWIGRDQILMWTEGYARSSGVNLFLLTFYPEQSAIEDITKASYVGFFATYSVEAFDRYTGTFVNAFYGSYFNSDTVLSYDYDSEEYYMIFSDGQFDHHGNRMFGNLTWNVKLLVTDYQQLVTYLNNVNNDGTIKDYTDLSKGSKGDPSQEGDPSGPGGGGGSYDDTSDPIDFPPLPSNGAITCGAIKTFAVSAALITRLFEYLWNTNIFDLSTWQKLMEQPLDSLVELSAVPIVPHVSGSGQINLGNIETNISAPIVDEEYYKIDCGQLQIKRFWGSALDYEPYTKVEIYLPFIGIRQLKTEDVMNSTVHVLYHVNIFTGDMVAFIKCGMSVLYHFTGSGKEQIPVMARIRDQLTPLMQTLAAAGSGNPAAAIASAVNVALAKTQVSRSGSLSATASLMDDFVPYLIIHRPQQSLAKDFKTMKGYPSNITANLGSLRGYTEVEHINLQNIPDATELEMLEIKSLLNSGVIL